MVRSIPGFPNGQTVNHDANLFQGMVYVLFVDEHNGCVKFSKSGKKFVYTFPGSENNMVVTIAVVPRPGWDQPSYRLRQLETVAVWLSCWWEYARICLSKLCNYTHRKIHRLINGLNWSHFCRMRRYSVLWTLSQSVMFPNMVMGYWTGKHPHKIRL